MPLWTPDDLDAGPAPREASDAMQEGDAHALMHHGDRYFALLLAGRVTRRRTEEGIWSLTIGD